MDNRFVRILEHCIVEPAHPLVYAWPSIRYRIIRATGSAPWFTLIAIRRVVEITDLPDLRPVYGVYRIDLQEHWLSFESGNLGREWSVHYE